MTAPRSSQLDHELGVWIERSASGPTMGTLDLGAPGTGADLPEVGGLLAGAAEVDITPPPGMPKAGHSRTARDGQGFRTRLRARVIHLRSGRTSLTLVAADMHAGSAVVQRLLASELSKDTDLGLAGLFLGSTHTHAGPGQFHGCDFYNRWASNRTGLDPAYVAFLVSRLALAARSAHQQRRPARMAVGCTDVWGFTRNRSLGAHVLNPDVLDKRTAAQRKYAAINPALHLLRVDTEEPDGGYGPLATLAVFSIHGTSVSREDPLYNADVWGYMTGEMSRLIERRTGRPIVAGAVEGTHGDVTPAVRSGQLVHPEAERLGRGIGAAAADLHARLEAALTGRPRLGAAYREIDLARRPVIAGVRLPDPAVGAAKLAGAVENSVPVVERLPPFRPGFPKPAVLGGAGGHGAKWVVGGRFVQHRLSPVDDFPRVLPLQLLRLGTLTLLALPFEVTVEAGRHLRAAVNGGGAGSGDVVVSSVANDYWDYLTTPSEYALQCYEGASTLYGPRSLEFVAGAAVQLLRELPADGMVQFPVRERRYRGLMRRYLPAEEERGGGPPRSVGAEAHLVEATATDDAYWDMPWTAGPPGSLCWDSPLARIEELGPGGTWRTAVDDDGEPVDDRGWRLGVVHLGPAPAEDRHRYAARWYQPRLGAPARWRLVLEENQGHAEVAGAPFD